MRHSYAQTLIMPQEIKAVLILNITTRRMPKAIPVERPGVHQNHHHHLLLPAVNATIKRQNNLCLFFIFRKMNFLKSSKHFFLTAVFIVLLGFGATAQSSKAKYTDYDRGYRLMYYENWDSAFLMFNRYVNNPDDSLKKAKAYRYMGEMQRDFGDLFGAQENLVTAIRILDPSDEKHREDIGYTYYMLGNVSLDLKLYDEAIHFYNKAIPFLKGADFLADVMNAKATALQKNKRYNEAIAVYDSIITLGPTDQKLVARVTDNQARTRWLQDPGYNALPRFWSALKIRAEAEDNQALNASYAHLADYYEKANRDSALWYAQKMLEKAKENQSTLDVLEAVDKLIRLNDLPAAKDRWYAEYKILNDSLQIAKDTTRDRFALIRYNVQKSKADNLILQENLTKQRLLIYGLSALAILIITGLLFWNSKRRKRIKQDAEIAIRNSRLKTSQKIHDVVANGLYRIMNELEHGKTVEKEPLLDKIEVLYEKSRDISYEDISTVNTSDHSMQLHNLLMIFNNEQTKVSIVGNEPAFWNKISKSQKKELQLVLGEIMVNMKKHSLAKNVEIIFKLENGHGQITYQDDGIGFSPDAKFGNGLNNTVNRIRSLNGEVNFGKSTKAGVFISISLPLQSKIT